MDRLFKGISIAAATLALPAISQLPYELLTPASRRVATETVQKMKYTCVLPLTLDSFEALSRAKQQTIKTCIETQQKKMYKKEDSSIGEVMAAPLIQKGGYNMTGTEKAIHNEFPPAGVQTKRVYQKLGHWLQVGLSVMQ
jgi:hypothetical protein